MPPPAHSLSDWAKKLADNEQQGRACPDDEESLGGIFYRGRTAGGDILFLSETMKQ
jgi:hypothetical protein